MQSKQVLTMRADQVQVAASRVDDGATLVPGWQATVHRVAAGQALWLDVRAGQWLKVRAGALALQDAGAVRLDARWAMGGAGEAAAACTHVPSGEVMRVNESGRCRVQAAEAGELCLVVWRPLSSWQRLKLRLRQPRARTGRQSVGADEGGWAIAPSGKRV